jgi:hypothetical protein
MRSWQPRLQMASMTCTPEQMHARAQRCQRLWLQDTLCGLGGSGISKCEKFTLSVKLYGGTGGSCSMISGVIDRHAPAS